MSKTVLPFILFGFIFISFSCQKDAAPRNKVPIANAGPSQTIMLADNFAILKGSGTDTDGKIVAYLWSQVSGPSSSNIANPGSPLTEVRGFITGTYLYQLMVTDNMGAVGVDTTRIVVKSPVFQTLTQQPTNNPYEYQVVNLGGRDASGPGPEISIASWTKNSELYNLRNIFKFDLSTIPVNATITSATLYLYSNPFPLTGNFTNANFGTDNTLLLQQVTSNWGSSINWFNQPSVSVTNQIIIPSTTQSTLDLNIDVTGMVKSMVSGNSNFGFYLRLQNEVIYNSRIFISSQNTIYPDKHPKLVVVYK